MNLTTSLPDSNSEYYTWEITATKRQHAGWSLLASFTHTWSHEAALGTGNDFTPNALINAAGTQDRFRTWQAKLNGTMDLPLGLLVVPVVRHQSGNRSRAPSFTRSTTAARPSRRNRSRPIGRPTSRSLDVRTEKTFRIKAVRVMGFFDVYNIFNTNAAQTLTTSSGGSWLRPTAITGPRVLRIGARLQW